jgi:glycine/sarcosine N-methyltransferase
MTEFYQSIAHHYDDIFPLSDMLKKFLLSLGICKKDHVLDIGCATGEVALFVSQSSASVTGIDLDPDLIAIAQSKQQDRRIENVLFQIGNMERLDVMFSPDEFSFALCLGNTLVHLQSPEAIDSFFRKVANVLSDGGIFIFQILNYEKILARKTINLPVIDNEKIIFERQYDHERHSPHLAFDTRLTIKTISRVIANSIDLYPLQREEIMGLPGPKQFRSCQFLGGFDGKVFSEEDDLLIGILQT